jgi:NAD(P)-dependent dehydrogenase (short-subunit alcohol dehydrogenase family)
VAAEVRELGGEAVASYEDVADWDRAAQLIQTAVTAYGQLDVLVNNAGVRDLRGPVRHRNPAPGHPGRPARPGTGN